jgi:hypothetical protein
MRVKILHQSLHHVVMIKVCLIVKKGEFFGKEDDASEYGQRVSEKDESSLGKIIYTVGTQAKLHFDLYISSHVPNIMVPSGKQAGSSTSKEVIITEQKDTCMKNILCITSGGVNMLFWCVHMVCNNLHSDGIKFMLLLWLSDHCT